MLRDVTHRMDSMMSSAPYGGRGMGGRQVAWRLFPWYKCLVHYDDGSMRRSNHSSITTALTALVQWQQLHQWVVALAKECLPYLRVSSQCCWALSATTSTYTTVAHLFLGPQVG